VPTLESRLGNWELDHLHMWKDRGFPYVAERVPLIEPTSRIATIGSCFATELARGLERFGLAGGQHPAGLFYNTKSIRQELERIAGTWSSAEPYWPVNAGYAHPFKDVTKHFATEAELTAWSDAIDREADALFRSANVVVVTLGLIETWRNPDTGNTFRQIPHPEAFGRTPAEFHRLSQATMREDLEVIRRVVVEELGAKLVVTVSPVPLVATMTALDVQVANTESKSRIRSAVSEFVEAHDDVHYFHSYELVTTAERTADFMKEDGRHVQRRAVELILADFLRVFAAPGVTVPEVDRSWLTETTQRASPAQMQDALRSTKPPAANSVRADARALARKVARRARARLARLW
jgi:hypothetical protein